jgi:hypothetical protein
MSKLIVNCETGEEITRELTKAEKDQQKVDEAEIAAQQAEAEAKETARQAVLDRLGLTADEAKLLLG